MKDIEIIELSLLYEKLKNAKKRGYLKAYNKHLQAIKDLVITDKEVEYNRKQILKISPEIVVYKDILNETKNVNVVNIDYKPQSGMIEKIIKNWPY